MGHLPFIIYIHLTADGTLRHGTVTDIRINTEHLSNYQIKDNSRAGICDELGTCCRKVLAVIGSKKPFRGPWVRRGDGCEAQVNLAIMQNLGLYEEREVSILSTSVTGVDCDLASHG